MLESELHDRDSNDDASGGRGAEELNPNVPAAVFQPPPVVFQPVFQPPTARPEPAQAGPATGSPAPSGSSGGRAGTQGDAEAAGSFADPGAFGDDDDSSASGRRRRRRPSRGRARNGDQDVTAEAGDDQPESQGTEGAQGASRDPGDGADQPEGRRPAARTRSRRGTAGRDASAASASAASASGESAGAASAGSAAASGAAEASGPSDDDDDADSGSASARRRRRKRRRGSAEGAAGSESLTPDDPPDTVVHVREPSGNDDVRSVKGSTRLEAKRQRRREGRETGRRRPPIVTESEFLARRESVERTMVVRQRKDRTQIAVLEDGVLVEHYVNRSSQQSYVGNVYLGKVQNVLPSMEAAFVDVGKGRNAVLYAGEVNFDVSGLEGQPKRIESALKSGQSVIVQVTKDPVGHKGARLTSQVSLPGRYLVYVPGASMTGISRKLPDTERNRLKQILKRVMPENAGVIVRTAAEGAAEEELDRDVTRLAAQWEAIEKKAKTATAPALLYSEPDLTIRVIRDVFNEDFSQLIVSGDEAWDVVDEYVKYVAPHLADRITRWEGPRDAFADYRIDEQLAKALERKVWLPSGGSLVIDKTEAMTVVDVNTGKFTGQGGNLEETVTRNNLEAAEELVRQLRLRDVGGIVVIDFIDMVLESNRELVLRRMLECLARDRTKHQVAEVTSLGLVQMTRKRVGAGLLEAFSTPCECCNGRGVILTFDPDTDTPAPHHLHARGNGGNQGNGGNGARAVAAAASPASVAARTQSPSAQPSDAQSPDAQSPDAQSPDAQSPDAQSPDAQSPDAQSPDTQPSGAQPSGAQPSDSLQPDGTQPDGATLDGAHQADSQVPGGQVPGGQVPGGQVPGGQVPGGRVAGGQRGNRQRGNGRSRNGQRNAVQADRGELGPDRGENAQPGNAEATTAPAEPGRSSSSSGGRRRRRKPAGSAASTAPAAPVASIPETPHAQDGAA
jgi:ribonuclease E